MNAEETLAEAALTEHIIGTFYEVFKELGAGFLEGVYENAMVVALRQKGLRVERQVPFTITYHGEIVGEYRADLIVQGRVILEIKAVVALTPAHEAQLLNYLKASSLEVGLLMNFGSRAEFKRKVLSQRNPRLENRCSTSY